jgi:hypothetical protein
MKAISSPGKSKFSTSARLGKNRPAQGELFLGYKALHELRILMRIAAPNGQDDSKPGKTSF